MAVKSCTVCNQQFAKGFNLRRHERAFGHGSSPYNRPVRDVSAPDRSAGGEAMDTGDADLQPTPTEQTGGMLGHPGVPPTSYIAPQAAIDDADDSQIVQTASNVDEEMASGEEDEDGRTTDEDGNTTGGSEAGSTTDSEDGSTAAEPDYWRDLIAAGYEQLETKYAQPSDATREPYLSELVEEIRKNMKYHEDLVQHMYDDDTFLVIQDRVEKCAKEGLDDEGASVTGWNDRRFIIRPIIAQNLDLFEDSEDEEEDEKEEEESGAI